MIKITKQILKFFKRHFVFTTIFSWISLWIYIHYDYGQIVFEKSIHGKYIDWARAFGVNPFGPLHDTLKDGPDIVYRERSFDSWSTPWNGSYTGTVYVLKYPNWQNNRSVEALLNVLNRVQGGRVSKMENALLSAHQTDRQKVMLLSEHERFLRKTVWMRAKDFDAGLFYNPYGYPLAWQYKKFAKSTAYRHFLKPDLSQPVGYVVHLEILDRFLNELPKGGLNGRKEIFFARDYAYALGSLTWPHYLARRALSSKDLLVQAEDDYFTYFDPQSGVGVVVLNGIYGDYGLVNSDQVDLERPELRKELMARAGYVDRIRVVYYPFNQSGEQE